MAKSLTIEIKGEAGNFVAEVHDAEGALGDLEKAAESGSGGIEGMGSKLKGFASQAAAVFAGGALLEGISSIGGKISDAFSEAMDLDAANDKLAAQLGLSAEASENFGRTAGSLYANAYGESMGEVNDALRMVQQNIGDGIGVADEALELVTGSVLDLSAAFGEDLGPTTRAVGTMIKSGLVKDAQEGLDILTVGLQNGTNAGEDLMDTFAEYSTQFREVGISAKMALGLMSQGMQAGARDSDTLADAIKEFAIRSKDASASSAGAFQSIGLDAKKMTDIFAKGGPEAEKAMVDVIRRIKEMKNPTDQNTTAVALFGTKVEDLGDALYALDPTTAVAALGEVDGAAARMGTTLADNAATKLEAFKRQMQMGLVNFIREKVLPAIVEFGDRALVLFNKVRDGVRVFIGAFTGEGADVEGDIDGWIVPISQFGNSLRILAEEHLPRLQAAWAQVSQTASDFWATIKGNEAGLVAIAAVIGVGLVVAFLALAGAAWSAAAGVIAATWPFIAVGAAVFALVAGLRWAYENWEWFRVGVQTVTAWLVTNVPPIFEMIRAAVQVAFDWIINVAVPWVQQAFASFLGFLNDTFLPAVRTCWEGFTQAVSMAVAFVRPIIDFLVLFIQDNFGHIVEIVMNQMDMIRNVIANVWQIISNIFQLALNIITGNWGAAWENIKNICSAALDMVRNIVANTFGNIREIIQMSAAWIGSIGGRMWEGIRTGFVNVLNWIIDRWNGLSFSTPNIPGTDFGGVTIGVPKLSKFHSGGVFRTPNGRTEGLALLQDGERVVPRAMAGMSGGGEVHVHIHMPYGFVGSEEQLGRAVQRAWAAADREGFRTRTPAPA